MNVQADTAKKTVLLAASTLTIMSGATISASLPLIRDTFSDNPNADFLSRLILTLPALLIAIVSPFAGYLVDRLGRKKLLIASLLLYALGGTLGGLVNSLTMILVSRALLGAAVAIVMTTTSTLIADYYEGEERSDLLGKQAAAIAIGGILFISAGGWLAEISWRGPFFVYLLSLLVLAPALFVINEPARAQSESSALGVFKLESKRRNTIFFLYGLMFITMVIFYMVPVQIPFLLDNLNVSSSRVGIAVAASTLSGAISSLSFRRLNHRINSVWLYAAAFLVMGTGYVLISSFSTFEGVTFSLFVAGFGNGIIMPNTNFLVMNLAPDNMRGQLLGVLSAAIFLGQFFSPIAVNPIIQFFSLSNAFLVAGFSTLAIGGGFILYGWISAKQAQIKQTV